VPQLLPLYRALARRPGGRRLFSLAVCWKAPYFRSVRPVFVDLRPGRGEVRARNRRAVRNHIEPVVPVDVLDERDTVVVHADITMWLSPRPARRAPGGAPAVAPA
jgi:hypothetical protein